MKEITLTKTFVIKNNELDNAFENEMYSILKIRLFAYLNIYKNINDQDVIEWVLKGLNDIGLEKELKQSVNSYLTHQTNSHKRYLIKCRNYLSIHTNLHSVKPFIDLVDNSIYFVLFFDTQALFFVSVIESQLIVSPLSNVGDIYHIDMSDSSISIKHIPFLNQ
jgi:hypothetical protein